MKKLYLCLFLTACVSRFNPSTLPIKVGEATALINEVFGYNIIDDSGKTIEVEIERLESPIRGLTRNRVLVILASDLENYEVMTVLLHELGHAMGLNHVDETDDIMYIEEVTYKPLKELAGDLVRDCELQDKCKEILKVVIK